MATQRCIQGFTDVITELEQRELMIEEGKARLAEKAGAHFPEYFRTQELLRYQSRAQKNQLRSIDTLIRFAYYGKKGQKPDYQPWMVEHMVVEHPFSLGILLEDLQVFLDFEKDPYLTFWQKVKARLELTIFEDPKTGQTVRTQYASLQAKPKFKSYWS